MPLLNHGRYHIINTWIENQDNNTQRVYVYAGEIAGPGGEGTSQGVVVVQVFRIMVKNSLAVSTFITATEHPTSIQAGPVKIIDAVGERLALQSVTNATKFYFDVPSRQFVSSLTAIVPTVPIPSSPLATPTPAP